MSCCFAQSLHELLLRGHRGRQQQAGPSKHLKATTLLPMTGGPSAIWQRLQGCVVAQAVPGGTRAVPPQGGDLGQASGADASCAGPQGPMPAAPGAHTGTTQVGASSACYLPGLPDLPALALRWILEPSLTCALLHSGGFLRRLRLATVRL